MNINKSKVTLAAKIKSSGFEWPQFGKWATQDKDGEIFISGGDFTPVRMGGEVNWEFDAPYKSAGKVEAGLNWFQCILSRAEYFHLYPAPDAKPEFCESVMRSIPEPEINSKNINITQVDDIGVVESKSTIEQLAADYRNAKDYAERKQKEAGDAKADADTKLTALELAGEALGLLVSPITAKQEPELVITDWRQWRGGDVVSWSLLNHAGEFEIISVHHDQSRNIGDFEVKDKQGGVYRVYGNECRFIRRP